MGEYFERNVNAKHHSDFLLEMNDLGFKHLASIRCCNKPTIRTHWKADMGTVNTLINARNLIERGWVQNNATKTVDGQVVAYCAGHALSVATHEDVGYEFEKTRTATNFIAKVMGWKPDDAYRELVNWNDEKGRTQEEVLALFDKAIELAKGETL